MDKLPVSVIIVAKNTERTIKECLDSVQRNSPAEVIVIDGISSDKTVEITRKYTERIYSDGGKGLNYARQLGVEQAREEYIAYVDSDVILADGTLKTMLAEFQDSEYICMSAREGVDKEFTNYWKWGQYQHNQLRNVENCIGTFASLFKREIILKYGFDLSERSLDDADLGFRLGQDGYKFGTSSAFYYHRYRGTLRSLIKHRFSLGRVVVRYIRKYGLWHAGFWPPLITPYWLAICLIKAKPKLIPYFLVDGIAKTGGMAKGVFELIMDSRGKNV